MRNHNDKRAASQEPYLWPSVAEASRTALASRYRLLPYWVSLSLVGPHHQLLTALAIVHTLAWSYIWRDTYYSCSILWVARRREISWGWPSGYGKICILPQKDILHHLLLQVGPAILVTPVLEPRRHLCPRLVPFLALLTKLLKCH